ncbi:MAG TPA: hypothetical protein VKY31_08740, partial [Terriglobia bacterium]|nr:hypothetical protein [Terriglobia bacterium]
MSTFLTFLTTLVIAFMTPAPLIFPHYVQGGGYQTAFTFNNLSTASTVVALEFHSQNGSLTGSASLPLAGLGLATYTLTGTSLSAGWARAQFTGSADVVGTETIQFANSTGLLSMETSVFAAQPDTLLRIPVYEKGGLRTGIALLNLAPALS